MCGGSKSEFYPFVTEMENKSHKSCSELLELAATDDLASFIHAVEEKGSDVNEARSWYGRSFGSKKMGFQERTPIMIASLYGSTEVLKYILLSRKVDVNKPCGSDGATALHCAAAGGAWSCVKVVELLIGAGGDINAVDANGKRAGDLIAPCVKSSSSGKRKMLEMMLNGGAAAEEGDGGKPSDSGAREGSEKKEYPMDASLPDINSGVYGSDEFRMYNFKVKTCSRAYTHDWTECPFVHPGENARRRDPRKYNYSCVPCPEFKKGSCGKGDGCEYAHGVFESWLHPAQYRTRLCKDEIGCTRKVCFFAHKHEELRPLYASTGSAMPSPPSSVAAASSLASSSPSLSPCSSPMWQGKVPAMQLSGSRLKASLGARDLDLDEMAAMPSSPYHTRLGDLKPTNLEEFLGSLDPSTLSHLQGMSVSPKVNSSNAGNSSPGGLQIRQNMNHMRASYPASSPARKPAAYSSAAAFLRSQSFIDQAGASYRSASPNPSGMMPSKLSDWSSPDGKLDWGFNDEDASKLRKSASFGFRMRGGLDVRMQQHEMMPHWIDQMCMDQEQMVA